MFSATTQFHPGDTCIRHKRVLMGIVCFLWIFTPHISTANPNLSDAFDKARQHFYLNEFDEAYSILSHISQEACKSSETADLCVQIKTIQSSIYRRKAEYDAAEDVINRALLKIDESENVTPGTTIKLFVQNSYLLSAIYNIQDAFTLAERAHILAEEQDVAGPERAGIFLLRGRLHHEDGNFNEAIADYTTAQQILDSSERTLEVSVMLTVLHNNIGISYRRLGSINMAMEHFQTNLALVRETFGENHQELGYAYNSIGTVYYIIGDLATAANYFERSASISRTNLGENSSLYLAALNNAGISYIRMGDLTTATNVLERAQRLKETNLGLNHPETAVGYLNLAYIYYQNEKFNDAHRNYELAISVYIAHFGENHPSLVSPIIQFGDFYRQIGEVDLAREQFRKALDIAESRLGSNHPDVWDITRKIGSVYLDQGLYSKAVKYFRSAIEQIRENSGLQLNEAIEFDTISHPLELLNALRGMANANLMKYRAVGNQDYLNTAQNYYDNAAELVEYLQTRYQSEASKLSLLEENYVIFSNAIEVFYHQYSETGHREWADQIFEWSERMRARLALELLQNVNARNFAGVPHDILQSEEELSRAITHYYRRIHIEQENGFEADEQLISAFKDSLFYAKQELQEFTQALEKNYPSYHFLKYNTKPATLQQAQALLSEDETLISYIFTEDNLLALLIDRDNYSIVNLGDASSLPEQIETLRGAVISSSSREYSELAYQLYQTLVEPLRSNLSTEKLIVVPDHALHFLPFELLLTSENKPQNRFHQMPFLINDYQVSYAPSVSMLQHMADRKPDNPRNFLAMAPFNNSIDDYILSDGIQRYAGTLSPLPLTRYETTQIAGLFRQRRGFMDFFFPENADVFLDREASKSRLESVGLQQYAFIHFATHAFINESNPQFSGIALWGDDEESDNGIVYVSDIYNLNLNADLVVLGACETGLGTMYRGEGIIGFTRAFIYAGASNLVVSKWRVNDQPTSKLMIHFYEYIRNGHSYSEALQRAKLELVNHPEYAAPVNWAAFILQGR